MRNFYGAILVVLFSAVFVSFHWFRCREQCRRPELEPQEVVHRPVNNDVPLQVIRLTSEDQEQCNKQLADIPVTIYSKLPISSSPSYPPDDTMSSRTCAPPGDTTTSSSTCTGGGGGDEEGEICVICLEEYEDGQKVRSLPECKHMFHQECVDPWFVKLSSFCPVCRIRVIQRAVEPLPSHSITMH